MNEDAGEVEPVRGRMVIALTAACWGLGIGLVAGAGLGTLVVPLIGTGVGAMVGLAVALVPTTIATAALLQGAAPGTADEAYRRRVRVVTIAVGLAVVVIGVPAARRMGDLDPRGTYVAYAYGAIAVAIWLLTRADSRLRALAPGADGERDRGAWWLVVALAVLSVAVALPVLWNEALGPPAQNRRTAPSLLADVAGGAGLDLDDRWGGAGSCDDVYADGRAGRSATGSAFPDDERVAMGAIAAQLRRDRWQVVATDGELPRLDATSSDRVVHVWSGPGEVHLVVTVGCRWP